MSTASPPADLACVADLRQAAALMNPLRLRILEAAAEPVSASDLARAFRVPRQKLHYHMRALARTGFLRRAGQRKKRNMIERRWQATARAWVLAPEILGPVGADAGRIQDEFSAAYLLASAARIHSELGRAVIESRKQGKRLSTLAVDTELRFISPEQRQAFAHTLHRAMLDLIVDHTSPVKRAGPGAAPGRLYRLVVGCYPVPEKSEESESDEEEAGS